MFFLILQTTTPKMNKLKVRFMLVVCEFLAIWYCNNTAEGSQDPRYKKIETLIDDLTTEMEIE